MHCICIFGYAVVFTVMILGKHPFHRQSTPVTEWLTSKHNMSSFRYLRKNIGLKRQKSPFVGLSEIPHSSQKWSKPVMKVTFFESSQKWSIQVKYDRFKSKMTKTSHESDYFRVKSKMIDSSQKWLKPVMKLTFFESFIISFMMMNYFVACYADTHISICSMCTG